MENQDNQKKQEETKEEEEGRAIEERGELRREREEEADLSASRLSCWRRWGF